MRRDNKYGCPHTVRRFRVGRDAMYAPEKTTSAVQAEGVMVSASEQGARGRSLRGRVLHGRRRVVRSAAPQAAPKPAKYSRCELRALVLETETTDDGCSDWDVVDESSSDDPETPVQGARRLLTGCDAEDIAQSGSARPSSEEQAVDRSEEQAVGDCSAQQKPTDAPVQLVQCRVPELPRSGWSDAAGEAAVYDGAHQPCAVAVYPVGAVGWGGPVWTPNPMGASCQLIPIQVGFYPSESAWCGVSLDCAPVSPEWPQTYDVPQGLGPTWCELARSDAGSRHVREALLGPFGDRVWVELRGELVALARDGVGTRVIQTAVRAEGAAVWAAEAAVALEGSVQALSRCGNGNHVVQAVLSAAPLHALGGVLQEVAADLVGLARHAYGCRIVQTALRVSSVVAIRVVSCWRALAGHEFGHHVVEVLVKIHPVLAARVAADVVGEVAGIVHGRSMDPSLGWVLEKLMPVSPAVADAVASACVRLPVSELQALAETGHGSALMRAMLVHCREPTPPSRALLAMPRPRRVQKRLRRQVGKFAKEALGDPRVAQIWCT